MSDGIAAAQTSFLSTLPAGRFDRRFALAVLLASCLFFAIVAPFAQNQWRAIPAFLPIYQSALTIGDLMTAVLLFGQFVILRSRAVLVLSGAYLLSAFMAVAHALSFPGLFALSGMLGAGPQTTAWIYFLWHAAFPMLVILYALLCEREQQGARYTGSPAYAIGGAIAAALAISAGMTWLAVAGQDLLPPIMQGNRDAGAKIYVAAISSLLALVAFAMLWRRRARSVLDLWLAVVMGAWVFDIALAAVLNAGRYDVGWYVGRVYGLLAGSFVLIVLLLENSRLYAELARSREAENTQAQRAFARHTEHLRILHGIDRAIVAGESVQALVGAMIQPLRALLEVPRAIVSVFAAGGDTVKWLAVAGRRRVRVDDGWRYPPGLVGDVQGLRRGQPQYVDMAQLTPDPEVEPLLATGIRYYLVVPMLSGGELIGALAFGSESSGFPNEHVQIAQEVATQLAIALTLARSVADMARQRAFLRQVIDIDRNQIYTKDREGRFTLVNQAAADAYGTTVANLLGRTERDFVDDKDKAERAHLEEIELMDSGRDKFIAEEEITDAAGRQRWLQTIKSPIPDPAGRAELILGVATDITERKRSDLRIRQQLEYMNLLDRITRAIGERLDLKNIFQVVVQTLEENLPADLCCVCLRDPAAGVFRIECVGAGGAAVAAVLALGESDTLDIDQDGLQRCLGGALVYEPELAEVRAPLLERMSRSGLHAMVLAPLRAESGVFGLLMAVRRGAHSFSSAECEFLRQLSEHVGLAAGQAQLHSALQRAYDDLHQTQQMAMQEERLRALGQMASGIAHDINNALSPVSLYTESLLASEAGLSSRARGQLETIQLAIEDVTKTVDRMRELYRKRDEQLELAPLDLNMLVRQVVELTRARWHDMPLKHGILITPQLQLAADLPSVMGVENEIREALTNLVLNAVDAMPQGGALTLRTVAGNAATGRIVTLDVVDEGVGMDEHTRQRCLEPFFTTKGESGTGLGLAMVFGVVQRHGADLQIESTPGTGCTIRMVFDVPPDAATLQRDAPSPTAAALHLRLLIVDDDPVLLKSLHNALEAEGHTPIPANGGEEGVAAFLALHSRGEAPDIVITDLGMPAIDGRKVAAAVKARSPETPVILLTGWGQRMVADGDVPEHVDRVLAKPPKLRELREALIQLGPRGAVRVH